MASEEAFTRQRRSLNIVSISLIVYFSAGGKFSGDLGISTFGITLEHEIVAIGFVWVAFIYFCFRFTRFGNEAKARWEADRFWEFGQSKGCEELLRGLDIYREGRVPDIHRTWLWRYFNRGRPINFQVLNGYRYHVEVYLSDRQPPVEDQLTQIPWLSYLPIATTVYLKAMWRYESWSEYGLPKQLAWAAGLLGAYHILDALMACYLGGTIFCYAHWPSPYA